MCRDHHNGGGCPPVIFRRRSNASWVLITKGGDGYGSIIVDYFYCIFSSSDRKSYLADRWSSRKYEKRSPVFKIAIVLRPVMRTTVIGDPFYFYIIAWILVVFCEMYVSARNVFMKILSVSLLAAAIASMALQIAGHYENTKNDRHSSNWAIVLRSAYEDNRHRWFFLRLHHSMNLCGVLWNVQL